MADAFLVMDQLQKVVSETMVACINFIARTPCRRRLARTVTHSVCHARLRTVDAGYVVGI
eukprot:scaffold503_cov365-Prasinococcus_capsulatus_cf.AAC.10